MHGNIGMKVVLTEAVVLPQRVEGFRFLLAFGHGSGSYPFGGTSHGLDSGPAFARHGIAQLPCKAKALCKSSALLIAHLDGQPNHENCVCHIR